MILPQDYTLLNQYERKLVREEYTKIQHGKCYYCGQPLDQNPCSSVRCYDVDKSLFPKGFFNNPVHLHHSHDTGMTFGSVHAWCNAVLWQFKGE